ncbi:hypothetical protein CLOM_g15093 [Closterium sp. NIES-68]|nr:hypothetical protein CLOM_g15093 [Closterium sp. NIES-68]
MEMLQRFLGRERHLDHLLMHGRFAEAAALCPSALGNSESAWQWWIGNFARLQQLHSLLPYVPISNPKLSPATYEGVLVELLLSPHSSYHRQIPPTIARWPPSLYNLGAVIAGAEGKLLQHGSAIQLQLLAGLYVRNRDFVEALDVYLRLLVAQHRQHHAHLNGDPHGHPTDLAHVHADVDGYPQGSRANHADVDQNLRVDSVSDGKIAGRKAGDVGSPDRGNTSERDLGSSPKESIRWPGPDVFEFIREHRLVRHLLSPSHLHLHRLPSLFLIHPRRTAALLADNIALAPPETVVRQLLCVDGPSALGLPEPPEPSADVLSLRDSPAYEDSPAGSEILTGRERRMALHCYLHEVFQRMPEASTAFHPMQVELYADFDRHLLLPFLRSSDHYPLQDALNLCVQRGLVEEQVFLLTRMGDYKEALALLLDGLKEVNRAIMLAREVKEPYVWKFLLKRSATNPCLVTALMERASDIFTPKQLLAGVAPNTYLKELRQHLLAVLAASATEISLRQGCIALMESECVDLLCLFILQSQSATRVSSSSSTLPHPPLLPLPSSTATAAVTLTSSSQASPGSFLPAAAVTSLLGFYSRKPFRRRAFMGKATGTGDKVGEMGQVGRGRQGEGQQGIEEREEKERRKKEREEAKAVALAFRQLEMGEAGVDFGGMEGRGGVGGRGVRRGGAGGGD